MNSKDSSVKVCQCGSSSSEKRSGMWFKRDVHKVRYTSLKFLKASGMVMGPNKFIETPS